MKIMLERHAFAPELNKAIIRGCVIPVPGCTSITAVRAKLFAQKVPGLAVQVRTVYDQGDRKWLEKSHAGVVQSLLDAVRFARKLRAMNPGAVLIDGSVLPPVKTKIQILRF